MTKQEFLSMQAQDAETHADKALLLEVVDCMELALSQTPDAADIAPEKTAAEGLALIKAEAKKHGNACGPFRAAELLAEYLGVKYTRASKKPGAAAAVDLADFF
jgi:hypothetical protein